MTYMHCFSVVKVVACVGTFGIILQACGALGRVTVTYMVACRPRVSIHSGVAGD